MAKKRIYSRTKREISKKKQQENVPSQYSAEDLIEKIKEFHILSGEKR